MTKISGIDGFETEEIENLLAENNIYCETFPIPNFEGFYEIVIDEKESNVIKILKSIN